MALIEQNIYEDLGSFSPTLTRVPRGPFVFAAEAYHIDTIYGAKFTLNFFLEID